MDYKDYYAILGVSKTASAKEIRQAFRRLARQYHPDVNPNDKDAEAKFKEINEAYEVLSDEAKRKQYDELGATWEQYARAGKTAGTTENSPPEYGAYDTGRMRPEDFGDLFGEESPFSDFFTTYFATGDARTRTQGSQRGTDLEHPLEVTLDEVAHGGTRRLRMEDANGQVRSIEVTIPPGVRQGTRIRLVGQGAEGRNGGARGDLYLVATITQHSHFERRGDDLYTKVHAPLSAVLLGGEVAVPTLGKRILLTLPANTADGKTFRLRGKGLPRLNQPDQHGDLYAEVHVAMPERLTDEQRRLIEEFARLSAAEPASAR